MPALTRLQTATCWPDYKHEHFEKRRTSAAANKNEKIYQVHR